MVLSMYHTACSLSPKVWDRATNMADVVGPALSPAISNGPGILFLRHSCSVCLLRPPVNVAYTACSCCGCQNFATLVQKSPDTMCVIPLHKHTCISYCMYPGCCEAASAVPRCIRNWKSRSPRVWYFHILARRDSPFSRVPSVVRPQKFWVTCIR